MAGFSATEIIAQVPCWAQNHHGLATEPHRRYNAAQDNRRPEGVGDDQITRQVRRSKDFKSEKGTRDGYGTTTLHH